MLSSRSQDVRNHPWDRKLGKIDKGAEDTVILLSQSSCISFRTSNQFRILISALKTAMLIVCNFRYLTVCGTVRLWFDGICKSATTGKWSEIKSAADTQREHCIP